MYDAYIYDPWSRYLFLGPWPQCMYVWCMYLWSFILSHVCMMHVCLTLDPNACTYDAYIFDHWAWYMCVWCIYIYDPRSLTLVLACIHQSMILMNVCMMHIVSIYIHVCMMHIYVPLSWHIFVKHGQTLTLMHIYIIHVCIMHIHMLLDHYEYVLDAYIFDPEACMYVSVSYTHLTLPTNREV